MRRLASDLFNGAVLLVLALPWTPGRPDAGMDPGIQTRTAASTTTDDTGPASGAASDLMVLHGTEPEIARNREPAGAGPSDDFYQANCVSCAVHQEALVAPPRQALAESASKAQSAAPTSIRSAGGAVVPRIVRQRPKPVPLSINVDGGGSKKSRASKKKANASAGKRSAGKAKQARK